MKKSIALLIGGTIASLALAQTPAPSAPPAQAPRAAPPAVTPPAEVKPSVSATTATKADVKSDKTAPAVAGKTQKDATAKTPMKPKAAKTGTHGTGAVKTDTKTDAKVDAKADAKADTKKADKKP